MANDNFTFRSKENDIIAKTETDFFVVDHDFDPYSGDVSNFIAVAEHTKSNSQNTELDFLGDIITVKLPKDVYANYEKLDKSHDEMFHSSIVLGALTQAPRHSTFIKVNILSEVVSPSLIFKVSKIDFSIWSEPLNQQGVV